MNNQRKMTNKKATETKARYFHQKARNKSISFDSLTVFPTTSNVTKKTEAAQITKFSNVKRIETNGFQNTNHTKKTGKEEITAITAKPRFTGIDDFWLDNNETRQEYLRTANSSEINGFATKIRTMRNVPLETMTLKTKEDGRPNII